MTVAVFRFVRVPASAAVAAAAVLAGCGRGARPNASVADSAAGAPAQSVAAAAGAAASSEALSDEVVVKVRQAARDYVKEVYPHARVEGIYTSGYWYGNLYLAGVDMVNGADRRTLDLLVRRYVRENGSEYWRAEGYGDSAAMRSLMPPAQRGAAGDGPAASSQTR